MANHYIRKRVVHLGRITIRDDRTPEHARHVKRGYMVNLVARDEHNRLCMLAGWKDKPVSTS